MEADIRKITSVEDLLKERSSQNEDLVENLQLFLDSPAGGVIKDLIIGKINQAGTLVLDGDLGSEKSDGMKCTLRTYKSIGVVEGLKSVYDDLMEIVNYTGEENDKEMG